MLKENAKSRRNCFLAVVYLLAKMTLYSPSGAVLTIKVVVLLKDNMSKEDTSESQRMLRTLYTCWNKEPGCKDSEPKKEHCPGCSYTYHFSILFENILACRICRIPTRCMIWRRKNDRIISVWFWSHFNTARKNSPETTWNYCRYC